MIPVLSRAQIRAFDAEALRCSVPSLVLMENAGRGACDVLVREMLGGEARGKRVVIVCGTGNNGGDGFVIARHLLVRGATIEVVLCGDPARFSADAKSNHAALCGLGQRIDTVARAMESADAVVDAVFGTGLDRAVSGAALAVIGAIAEANRVFAVDVPSGLDAQTGAVLGAAVRAAHTATFAHYKLGLLTPSGASHAGRVHVVDIGVPGDLVRKVGHDAELLQREDVSRFIGRRDVAAHKYRAGHVGVLAGSPGKIGAALLVARGALRAGAGAATISTWHDALPSLQARVLEVMTAPLDASDKPLIESVASFAATKRAVVAGPGFGTDERASTAIAALLIGYEGPVVLDADALTIHQGRVGELASARAKLVLTPHSGEAARLLGITAEAVEADRFTAVRAIAAKSKAVVVLKGAHSLIATPAGRVVISDVANATLATAGSGDVLAGILGALACIMQPFEAACAAVYLHGHAADGHDRGLLASEIADHVPRVFATL